MLFVTKKKVTLELLGLLSRIAQVEGKVKRLGEEMSGMDDLLGRSPQIVELEVECNKVWQTLSSAAAGLQFNQVSPREINRRLPNLDGTVRHYERLITSVEKAYIVNMAAFEKSWEAGNA